MTRGARKLGRSPVAILLCVLVAWSVPFQTRSAPVPDLDRAELLSWWDAPAALQLLDKLQPTAQTGDALVQWLMVRGLAYALGGTERAQAQAIIQRLHELGATQRAAEAASHIVRAGLYVRDDQHDRADAELNLIRADATLPAFVRFRQQQLLGSVQMMLSRREAALATLERARDLANSLNSMSRMKEATGRLAAFYTTIRNLDRATTLLTQLRTMAQQTDDEPLWIEVCILENDIADARGDRAEQRRALLEGLYHARRVGGERFITGLLIDLAFFYLETNAYAQALDASTEAMALAHNLKRPLFERLARFDLGLAQIGLGHLTSGKQEADSAIQQSLTNGDLYNADTMLRQYRTELERVGDLRGALEVWRREDSVRDKLATTAREKALLELSAKFDNERRVRQIELLERDNTIKSHGLQMQRLRQQMIAVATALIALVCGALAWGILRIRKVNSHLLHNTKHDILTGLLNRSYFNEHILTQQANRPYVGCLLLVGIDRIQQINETLGYSAGDGVLSVVSKRLSSTLRDCDALVRWSSEEFLAMTGPMSDAELNLAVRRLLAAIESEPVSWNGESVTCTVSIGYASFPVQGSAVNISLDGAITLVAKALHRARRRGGNRACLITLVKAHNAQELSAINTQFEAATSDRRVELIETRAQAEIST